MANLSELLTGEKKEQVVEDCCSLIDAEVKDKSGISGLAIKAGYGAVKGIKPGFVRNVVGDLLPEFAKALEPVWHDAKKDSKPVGAVLRREHRARGRRAPRDHRREGPAREERGGEGDVREASRQREEERRGGGASARRDGAEVRTVKSALAGVVALTACAKPVAVPSAPAVSAPAVWSYEVAAQGGDLDVEATFPRGTAPTLSLEGEATEFVADVAVASDRAASVASNGGVWTIPACAAGCTLRYRFHLAAAARSLDDPDSALASHDCIEAPPSTWLIRPTEHAEGTTYRFHVRTGAGSRFATGVHPLPGAPDTYGAGADDLDIGPVLALRPLPHAHARPPGHDDRGRDPPRAARDRRRRDRSLDRSLGARDRRLLRALPRPALPPRDRAAGSPSRRDGRTGGRSRAAGRASCSASAEG